ncbi:MAG: hypothetical protein KH322_05600 [Peptoniphilaceae bacterium]|nr:hypothetical protein [Peptoniphilaceae bacterium]
MNNMEQFANASSSNTALFAGVGIITVIAWWKLFSKAGFSGILAIIPIVNLAVASKIVFDSYWYTLLFAVPVVNVIYAAVLNYKMMKYFECSTLLAVLAIFFPFFLLFPAFGSNEYHGPATNM